MECFHVDPGEVGKDEIILRGEESKHLARVLRKKVGDRVWVTDGKDRMFVAEVLALSGSSTTCRIVECRERFNEPEADVTLGVSLLRNPARFDYLVEKATELGVRTIVPLICERTIPRKAKVDRLQHIALSAMKQSCRSFLPVVGKATSLQEFLQSEASLRLIPHEETPLTETLHTILERTPNAASIAVAIGPEGGFTGDEISAGASRGWAPVSFGPRRLRSETAALAACSILLTR